MGDIKLGKLFHDWCEFMKKIKWRALLLGVFIIALSVVLQYLSQTNSENKNIYLILCIFSVASSIIGGIEISRAFENNEEFIKRLNPRLSAIIRKSSINTAMINQIIQSEPNSTLATRIQDAIPHLSSVTTDLISLTGGDLACEIANLNNNLKELQQVALRISAKSQSGSNEQKKSEEQFNTLVNKVINLSDLLSPLHIKTAEVVKCPYCNHENTILIGQVPPASACPICSECTKRFHANRQHDGSILIKKSGGE